jgi:DNA helicase-2/ATP-dependent DNA helicase PcrA
VESFLVLLEDELMNFKSFEYRGFKKTEEEIVELFYYKFTEHPLLSRMEAVMEYIVDEYETLYGRNLSEEEFVWIRDWFMRMYETMDVYEIYNQILEQNGYERLPDVPVEERVLDYEDVYPLLYLKQRLCATKKDRNIRHLVIDEMQDYSYLQYVILESMFSCRMTILGDRAQTVDTKPQDVQTFLPKIFGKEIKHLEMNRSYRNTLQIAAYAKQWAKTEDIKYLDRNGKEVVICNVATQKEMLADIVSHVHLCREGYETAAILTMTEHQAKEIYKQLKKERKDVYYIDRDSSAFKKGITVTTYYMAKGLEFDQVFIAGGEKENPFYAQYQYISATRALHELYVYKR